MLRFQLHHFGFLVEDLAEGADHFANTFGFQVESDRIDDVRQTAGVQFLRLPGAEHWIELVTPLGEGSKLRGALERGVTLHHLCFECSDIDAAQAQLRANGCFPLGPPVPGAAYDGRKIVWMMDRVKGLIELVEAGPGVRSLAGLAQRLREGVG